MTTQTSEPKLSIVAIVLSVLVLTLEFVILVRINMITEELPYNVLIGLMFASTVINIGLVADDIHRRYELRNILSICAGSMSVIITMASLSVFCFSVVEGEARSLAIAITIMQLVANLISVASYLLVHPKDNLELTLLV